MPTSLAKFRNLCMAITGQHKCTVDEHDVALFDYQYRTDEQLGQGGFGTVYAGRRLEDKRPVAVKYIDKRRVPEWAELDGHRVPLEIVLLSRSQCVDGVIRMLDWYVHENAYIIVMERPSHCQDLFDYITENRRLSDPQARHFFKQIVEMTLALAALSIVHRDIKDENLLVDLNTGKLKLIDFGSGALLKSGAHEIFTDLEGTKVYAPAEWFMSNSYRAEPATVWSLGILLFDMVCGDIPFRKASEIVKARLSFTRNVSADCKDLIRRCLTIDVEQRITLAHIMQHPWMRVDDRHTITTAATGRKHGVSNIDKVQRPLEGVVNGLPSCF